MFFLVNIFLKFIAPRVCPGNTEKFCTSLARLLKGAWHDSKKQTCWYVLRDVLNVDRMKLAWHQGPGLYCSLNPLHRAQCLEHSRFIHSSTNSSLMNELMTHAQEDKGRSVASPSQKLLGIIPGGFWLTEIKAHTKVKISGGSESNKITIIATINRGVLMS